MRSRHRRRCRSALAIGVRGERQDDFILAKAQSRTSPTKRQVVNFKLPMPLLISPLQQRCSVATQPVMATPSVPIISMLCIHRQYPSSPSSRERRTHPPAHYRRVFGPPSSHPSATKWTAISIVSQVQPSTVILHRHISGNEHPQIGRPSRRTLNRQPKSRSSVAFAFSPIQRIADLLAIAFSRQLQ